MILDVFIIIVDLGILLGFAWYMQRRYGGDRLVIFWMALLAKLLGGIALGWVYFEHYGVGDTIAYWQDAGILAERMFSNPGEMAGFFWNEDNHMEVVNLLRNNAPRSLFFVKISAILAFVSGGNYWMMSMILSFVSFSASWYLFLRLEKFFLLAKWPAAVAVLFWPSAVFWGSGLIKESLAMSALFFLSGVLLKVIHATSVKAWEWVLVAISMWIGWSLKYYWLGVYLPVALATLVVVFVRKFSPRIAKFELLAWLLILILSFAAFAGLHPNFYSDRLIAVVWENNQEFVKLSDPGNLIAYNDLQPTALSMLLNAPQAGVAALFRPFIWETRDALSLFAGIENLLLLVAVLMAIPSIGSLRRSPYRTLVVATVAYIIALGTLLALSTPNLGTLSRYRIGFLPFLVFLVMHNNYFLVRKRPGNQQLS